MDTHDSDPHLWLEDVEGPEAMAWVRERKAAAVAEFDGPRMAEMASRMQAAFDASDRIANVVQRGDWYYNFHVDAANPRGLWRRTTPESYLLDEPEWDVILDIDALNAAEGMNWVWHGSTWHTHSSPTCLIELSRGGSDADEVREFDIETRQFVADGFRLPESKGQVSWLDDDTLFVARDFGPGTMTDAGYPREVRLWRRGEPLADATLVVDIDPSRPFVGAWLSRSQGHQHVIVRKAIDFFDCEWALWRGGELVHVDIPVDAGFGIFGDQALITLRSEWHGWPAGAMVAAPLEPFLAGERHLTSVFVPSERVALDGGFECANRLVLNVIDNVRNRLEVVSHDAEGWHRQRVELPISGTASAWALESEHSDTIHVTITDNVTPSTLFSFDATHPDMPAVAIKSTPPRFDATGLCLTQLEAISADGTRIPYTITGSATLDLDGSHPTILYGYGGFEVSLLPGYASSTGIGWLEAGGLYVVANIRGGGEFGPTWHEASRKENRQRCYDDFIAVAEDLIARGYTSAERLGISGGSNGGLLVGAVMVQRPDLFAAVSCGVPLLDMRRYHLLHAGASWIGEYGNPDIPEEWEYISRYSPYQNVRGGVDYPTVLFTTTTRDDRVHPGHARKMAARMAELGHCVHLFENDEGGHGNGSDNAQIAYHHALSYEFFRRTLIDRFSR